MKAAIPADARALGDLPAAAPLALAFLLVAAGCASGPTAEIRAARASAAARASGEAPPGDLPTAADRTSDRGRRTLAPSPIGQIAPEDAPVAPSSRGR